MHLSALLPFSLRINFIGLLSLCTSFSLSHGQTTSAEPPALVFNGQALKLAQTLDLPASHYTGGDGILTLETGNAGRASLRVSAGTLIENVLIRVETGSDLTIKGALLRRCTIEVQPKCSVHIEDSCLQDCDFIGQGDSKTGFAAWKITNSVIAKGACRAAINRLGIEMQDCVVIGQKWPRIGLKPDSAGGTSLVDAARNPRIRYTRFLECTLQPLQFHAMSHCTFEKCTASGFDAAGAPDASTSDVILPARWLSGTPSTLVERLSKGVRVQAVKDEFPGGCQLSYKWNGEAIEMDSIKENAIATPLSRIISGAGNMVSGSAAPAPGEPTEKQVKLKQTFINGLLVMPLASGKEAGQVSKMNLTTVEGGGNVRFNQGVGGDMIQSLHEVQKFMQLRHNGFPPFIDFELSFEEKYSEKDGPSAAVACGLLLESSITGKTWDPAFAVTGDMNADGSVQPIGGVGAKIRGATNGSCKIIAVPSKNEIAVTDLVIQDGPAALAKICVFTIKTFEEAAALASPERQLVLAQAVTEFEIIRTVLQRDPRMLMQILRTPQATARLDAILQKAPHCLSAKLLLMSARGTIPKTLSISGSIQAVDGSAQGLVKAATNDEAVNPGGSLKEDELRSTVTVLRNLRPKLDTRVWSYVDALVSIGETARAQVLNPSRSGAGLNEFLQKMNRSGAALRAAKQSLMSDPQVIEELGL